MVRFKKTCVLCYICFLLIKVIGSDILVSDEREGRTARAAAAGAEVVPAPDFSHHTLVRPRIFHGREKRELTTTREEDGLHVHDLTVGFDVEGRDLVLDLRLNRDLIPKSYFEKYQHHGRHVINRPTGKDVELCQYQGTLRGIPDSWAAISTCDGLSGVIFDGQELHYLEPGSRAGDLVNGTGLHFLYRQEHLQTNLTCGFPDTPHQHHILDSREAHRILRYKRSEGEGEHRSTIRGPYNANKQSRYVELVLVVDTKEFKELGGLPEVYLHCKKIANIINALYVPLNIFVALVGVVVWTELDDIVLSPNGDTTLANFLHYRRGRLAKEHPNDNAQLLTRMQFDGGVVGKALKGPICTYEFSGGVSVDHSSVVGLVATTVAHEMGHNFGMEHDTSDCLCPSERCIMAPSSNSRHPTHWSSCSLEYLAHAFEHGMDYCLRNKPERLFESPVCGNGFVEPGEQCDCGLPEFCNNPCCNASSCMLFSNASCATGECCDLSTCKPRRAGIICRSADHECDLPEFCTGESEFCPNNVFKMDGEKCDKGKAFCYQGSCRTHSDQCRLLWGPSGVSSDSQCYHMNTKGSQHGNCGYNRLNHSYVRCVNDDILCGMLHCKHLNERLEFGMESVAILSQTFLNTGGNIIPCRTAIVDLGLNEVDPGLAPDGARCGDGKMCVNQKCLPVDSLQKSACPNNCHGRGICNSMGHCHCDVGYAPPYCSDIGFGGSNDSGPATDPHADSGTTKFLIFLFAIIFMCTILLLAMFYTRYWRTKKKPLASSVGSTGASSHGRTEKDTGGRAMEISSPLSPSDSAHASLLTNTSEPVLNGLLGQHKGFTISPLQPTAAGIGAPPPHAVATAASAGQAPATAASTAIPTRSAPARPASTSPEPPAQPSALALAARPTISSPVLEATTSTAHHLISNALPTAASEARDLRVAKQAPEIPLTDSKILRQAPSPPTGYTPLAVTSPTKPRPLSSPTALNATEPVPNVKVVREGTSALSRIASMFHTNSRNSSSKTKLDREALRSLQISEPIPQKEIEIPGSKDVVVTESRPVVMRAHSLRDQGPVTPRPNIPNFGSMRGARRPVSIPTNRPTSPPPRPPPPKPLPASGSAAAVEYDDCLNLQSTAPLANIDEEMPSPVDNIYAVIEECPPMQRPQPSNNKKQEYTSPTGEYQSPRPVENSVSAGSSESVGLLSEIVSEMQARNMESIYTSTLGRKRKKKKEGQENGADDADSGGEDEEESKDEISPASNKSALASRFPDRASSISTSNSSLGTYVNAPYTTNRPAGGLYTNLSSRNSPTPSQGSSQAGYLRPNQVAAAPPPLPSSLPVVTTGVPTTSSNSFSTFKGPLKTMSETLPKTTLTSSPTPAPYKPFSSALQRPSGPLTGLRVSASTEKKPATFASKDSEPVVATSAAPTSKPATVTPSSSVVKSVLAAVENSKKVDIVAKPPASRSVSFADKKSPTESKSISQAEKVAISMANRPLPDKPATVNKTAFRNKAGPVTAAKPPTAPLASPEKSTPTILRSKSNTAGIQLKASSKGSVPNKNNKIPPTPPPPQTKPNKSSPDVVASCGREQGNREPDVVSPATSPPSAKPGLARQASSELSRATASSAAVSQRQQRPQPPAANRLSHVASLQQKFESASSSKPATSNDIPRAVVNKSKQPPPVSARSLQDNANDTSIRK